MNILRFLSFFQRTPRPAAPHTAVVLPFEKLPRAHFLNAVERAIRANRLDAERASIAARAAGDLWARHVARIPGYESRRLVEQIAVDYCADLARFQLTDQRVDRTSRAPWQRAPSPDASA